MLPILGSREGGYHGGIIRHKPGTEIRKLIREIGKAQTKATPVTFTFKLTIAFEELAALTKYVDKFIADKHKQKWLYKTEAQRVLLNAMEALAAALPSSPP